MADTDACSGVTPCQQLMAERLPFFSLSPPADAAASQHPTGPLGDADMHQESAAATFPTHSHMPYKFQSFFYVIYLIFH